MIGRSASTDCTLRERPIQSAMLSVFNLDMCDLGQLRTAQSTVCALQIACCLTCSLASRLSTGVLTIRLRTCTRTTIKRMDDVARDGCQIFKNWLQIYSIVVQSTCIGYEWHIEKADY
eukprot:TRINITY_DN660_c0_g1_i1.p2 TRINITY_DN660_c0_g1~~TRINITY_DN660_c0_g1_i1.p2  ORF type:complete len:118 (+),score=6.77 TRINITY_DN660_c0_g1_i1:515-868(+)